MLPDSLIERIIACDNIAAFFSSTRDLAIEVRRLRGTVPPSSGLAPWPVDPRAPRLGDAPT
jgi:hypothetical protein